MAKQKKQSKFRGKITANAKEHRQQESNYGYLLLPKGIQMFQPEPGKRHAFDILPYIVTDPNHPDRNDQLGIAQVGDIWYKRPFKIHRNIGGDNSSVICLTSFGKKCPICEYRAKMFKEGAAKEDTDALKPSFRNLYAIIPSKSDDIHIWDVSQYLFQNLLNDELEENEEYEVFPDLEEGLSLNVRFDSSTIGGSKPFAEASRIDFEERDSAYDESILKDIPNLDKLFKILSYQQLEAKFLEIENPQEEDDMEEEKPKENVTRRKKTLEKEVKKDEEEDEEDEEEEKPKENVTRRKTPTESVQETPKKGTLTDKKQTVEKKPIKSTDRCPYEYRFGIDTDKYNECDKCKIWDDCIEEKETNEGK